LLQINGVGLPWDILKDEPLLACKFAKTCEAQSCLHEFMNSKWAVPEGDMADDVILEDTSTNVVRNYTEIPSEKFPYKEEPRKLECGIFHVAKLDYVKQDENNSNAKGHLTFTLNYCWCHTHLITRIFPSRGITTAFTMQLHLLVIMETVQVKIARMASF
jgi:hypothetical protein